QVMYGRVAGKGLRPTLRSRGASWAIASAAEKACAYRKFPSGSVRWNVTVPASSSVTIPRLRSQAFGFSMHALAPRIKRVRVRDGSPPGGPVDRSSSGFLDGAGRCTSGRDSWAWGWLWRDPDGAGHRQAKRFADT